MTDDERAARIAYDQSDMDAQMEACRKYDGSGLYFIDMVMFAGLAVLALYLLLR